MRTIKFLTIFVLLLGFARPLCFAQMKSASNYFNEAAFLYTDQKTDEALELTKQGLERHPNDLPLVKLKELLEKQQQQEQEQQNQQQQQDQQQQENQQNKDDKKEQEQQKEQPQQNEDDKKQEDQQNKQDPDQAQQQPTDQQERRAEEMTPEEAQLLLDAMRDDEKAQRDAMRMIMGAPEPPQNGKDW